jgi:hypothetical protein
MPKKGSLLEVDIRAMSEIVDDLLLCHIKTEMMSDFPAVLERLRGNINDPAWQLKITYLRIEPVRIDTGPPCMGPFLSSCF